MKKSILLPTLFTLFLFASCEKQPEKLLEGGWRVNKITYTAKDNSVTHVNPYQGEYKYNKDGTGAHYNLVANYNFIFEWHLSDDHKKIFMANGNMFTQSFNVAKLEANHLEFTDELPYDSTGVLYDYKMTLDRIE